LHELTAQARAYAKGGRSDLALDLYRKALQRQPSNWVLYNEVSMFLTFSLGDVKAGIETARQALALNPTCSAELWNTLGDGLFKYGRVEEAQSAYCKALAINPSDVRSRYNLSWCHAHQKNYNAALTMIAEALDLDRTGEYRAKLEQKQDEVMAQVTRRNQREYLQMVNLVSHSAKKDGDK
jgi:tetratricopeptide (TPR) repeat protein